MAVCNIVENPAQSLPNECYELLHQDTEPLLLDASCSSIGDSVWLEELKHNEGRMPSDIKVGYYDVIIIYSPDNQEEAETFCEHLKADIKLEANETVKAVLYDCDELISVALSKIHLLRLALERSNYVFLFITNEFREDEWLQFCGYECLIKTILDEKQKQRLVPVYAMPENGLQENLGFNSLIGLNYFKNDNSYRQKVKRLIEDKLCLRQENERRHLKLISYDYKSVKASGVGNINSVQHKRTDDSLNLISVPQAVSLSEIAEDDRDRICIVKQFAYVKSEMSKESGRKIAKSFVAKKYMSQNEYEEITKSVCLRRHCIDLLLKKVILGLSGELKTFLDELNCECPDIAQTLLETEVTDEDRTKFAEVHQWQHGERNMFALLFGGCNVDDQDINFFEHFLCVHKDVIDDINDAMLSRFYFTVKDHEDIVQCKKNGQKIKMLFRKMQRCCFDAEFELENLLPSRLYRRWKEKRKNKGRLAWLRQWINTSRSIVSSVFEMVFDGAMDGSIILKFLTEENFNIEQLGKESIERKIKDLIEKGYLEKEKQPVSLICVTVFIKSSDITGPEEIHIYLDFDAADGTFIEDDKNYAAKKLMSEEMDPARLVRWMNRKPGLNAYQQMLLEETISSKNASRRQKMETILGILDGLEKSGELLAKYCKENYPYVYSEVYEKPKRPLSHADPALVYEKGGGLQKLYSFQMSFGTDEKDSSFEDLKEMSLSYKLSHCHVAKGHEFELEKFNIPEEPKAEAHFHLRKTSVLSPGSDISGPKEKLDSSFEDLTETLLSDTLSLCHVAKGHEFELEKFNIPEEPKAEAHFHLRKTSVLSPGSDISGPKEKLEIDEGLEGIICLLKQYAYIKTNLSMAQLSVIAMKLQQEGLASFSDFEAIAEKALPGDLFVNKFYAGRYGIDVVLKTVISRRSGVLTFFYESLKSGSPDIASKVAETEVTPEDRSRFARLEDDACKTISFRPYQVPFNNLRDSIFLQHIYNSGDVLADVMLSHFHISIKDHSRIVNSQHNPSKREILLKTMHLRQIDIDWYLHHVCPESLDHSKKREIAEHREGIICILKQYVNIKSSLSHRQVVHIAFQLVNEEFIDYDELINIEDACMLQNHQPNAVDLLLKMLISGRPGILKAFYESLKSINPAVAKKVAETEITHEDLSRFAQLGDDVLPNKLDTRCRNMRFFSQHLSDEDIDYLADDMLSRLSINIHDHDRIKRCDSIEDKIEALFTSMELHKLDPDIELSNVPFVYKTFQETGKPAIKSEASTGVVTARSSTGMVTVRSSMRVVTARSVFDKFVGTVLGGLGFKHKTDTEDTEDDF